MAARAMWKGIIRFGDVRLPVKLYSAVQDRSVHFRLLHERDGVPLEQRMINPSTGRKVEYSEARRGLEIERDLFVVFTPEELDALQPEPSRDIRITRFVEPSQVNHQWYDRPYYLGPDGSEREYAAFARALERRGRDGIARWTMRKKAYLGALGARDGHLLLVTLRHADEIIPASQLEAPEGRELEPREREMAEKFVGALQDRFDPGEYRDEYRDRVLQLIQRKAKGEGIEAPAYEEKEPAREDLADLLERSLAGLG